MKKSNCNFVFAAVLCSFLLGGCGGSRNTSYSVPEYKPSATPSAETEATEPAVSETEENISVVSETESLVITEAQTEAVTAGETEAQLEIVNDNTENETDISYDSIYYEARELYIRTKPVTNVMYQLYDVDFDGVPEMIVSSGEAHSNTCEIYTYKNGKVIDVGECGSYGFVEFNTDSGLLFHEYGNQGYLGYAFYKLVGSEFEHVISFYSDEGAVGTENAVFEIDGEKVSEEEYRTRRSEYKEGNNILLGRELYTAH